MSGLIRPLKRFVDHNGKSLSPDARSTSEKTSSTKGKLECTHFDHLQEPSKMATKCITYVRTKEGDIERKPGLVVSCSEDSMDPYYFEAKLTGFPESKVYWASEIGPSVGIAPING